VNIREGWNLEYTGQLASGGKACRGEVAAGRKLLFIFSMA